ncbi:hypothetical protein ACJIZ3_020287 [Penstemon smallii]|uniref:Protein OBERON 3 n=1 Tax=Penstemon smallii TaxID=265156 RepID=A0ABD3SIE0_9LAMI
MGIDFLGEKSTNNKIKTVGGFDPKRGAGNSCSQELTLSYLCENSKLGKEVIVSDENREMWVERDFLQLNDNKRGSLSEYLYHEGENNKEKKAKVVESLNLSLAPPDVSVSLSLAGSNGRPSRSMHSLGPPSSYNNTNDFTVSYNTHSHPFSHNPSCSITLNSNTENYDHQIWNCGEGTNGSVHSRFRPIGDGTTVALSNHHVYKTTTSSDNHSFFPSELPARPRIEDSSSEDLVLVGKVPSSSRLPERIVREIVSESIPVMAQIIQELTQETIESAKEYLKNTIANPEKKDELLGLQKRLERRCDLTHESLSKCHKDQLEVLVATKMGLGIFLSTTCKLPLAELVDIFLLERCRNINCRRVLPVDDCDCKICSTKKGFCSECMCPLCLNFDCASNTCSWVGCDVCSHWCHAACGLHKNLIKPGPSLKGPSGTNEMQFHCLGCGHASEMFGFVKDVFMSCAKDWGLENLVKELDCVRNIFMGSQDRKGKELHMKADEMLYKLQNKMITPPQVCDVIFEFFNYTDDDGMCSSKELSFGKDLMMPYQNSIVEDEWSVKKPSTSAVVVKKKDDDGGFEFDSSLESLVRIKEAEARMFQSRADEARREVENFRRMVRMKTEKLEQEYAEKLALLHLQETEERQRKKLDQLKVLENSHCDYYKMKIRMQTEISGLLNRMEATKQQQIV